MASVYVFPRSRTCNSIFITLRALTAVDVVVRGDFKDYRRGWVSTEPSNKVRELLEKAGTLGHVVAKDQSSTFIRQHWVTSSIHVTFNSPDLKYPGALSPALEDRIPFQSTYSFDEALEETPVHTSLPGIDTAINLN